MIKNCFGLRKKYKEQTSQIRVNKKINRSCINNDVPELSHQENNNYFYNTKIIKSKKTIFLIKKVVMFLVKK